MIDPEPAEAVAALAAALARPESERRAAVAEVVARWPRFLDGWARLGELGRDAVERYAYYRVGYHRGLDTLRASGWRGSGYVRWRHESNRGFLRALEGLPRWPRPRSARWTRRNAAGTSCTSATRSGRPDLD